MPVTKGQVIQMIKSRIDHETEDKYLDTFSGTPGAVNYNGTTPFSLSDVPQGVTDFNRTGDSILAKQLSFRALVSYNQTSTTTNLATSLNVLRLIVFNWKPFYTDVAPTVAKVMTYFGTAYAALGPLTHDGIDQIDVLFDKTIYLNGIDKASDIVKFVIPLNCEICYRSGSTTNQSNGIYAFWMSDVASAGPIVSAFASRLDFTDA